MLLYMAIAAVPAFLLFKFALGHKGEFTKPIHYGRQWAAWTSGIVIISLLPRYLMFRDADTLLTFFICLIFYPLIALAIGWCYGALRITTKLAATPKDQPTTIESLEEAPDLAPKPASRLPPEQLMPETSVYLFSALAPKPASRLPPDQLKPETSVYLFSAMENKRQLSGSSCLAHNELDTTTDERTVASVEKDWVLIERYYPRIKESTEYLNHFSPKLIQSLKERVLQSRDFDQANIYTENLIKEYLSFEFGPNETLQDFAKELYLEGRQDAAAELSAVIRLLSKSLDPHEIIEKVAVQFSTSRAIQIEETKRALLDTHRREKAKLETAARKEEADRQDALVETAQRENREREEAQIQAEIEATEAARKQKEFYERQARFLADERSRGERLKGHLASALDFALALPVIERLRERGETERQDPAESLERGTYNNAQSKEPAQSEETQREHAQNQAEIEATEAARKQNAFYERRAKFLESERTRNDRIKLILSSPLDYVLGLIPIENEAAINERPTSNDHDEKVENTNTRLDESPQSTRE